MTNYQQDCLHDSEMWINLTTADMQKEYQETHFVNSEMHTKGKIKKSLSDIEKQRKHDKEYKRRNKEKFAEYGKKYYLQNREQIKHRCREYRQQNKERINHSCKMYKRQNRERLLVCRKECELRKISAILEERTFLYQEKI